MLPITTVKIFDVYILVQNGRVIDSKEIEGVDLWLQHTYKINYFSTLQIKEMSFTFKYNLDLVKLVLRNIQNKV